MKLENVDIGKLNISDLPKFNKCPCELCDDGCFDRAGNKHHPECRRQPAQRSKLTIDTRCPLSHYKGTFLAATTISGGAAEHRRQPCPPAPDNEIPISFKNGIMSGISSQRDHFQAPSPPTPSKKQQANALANKHPDNIIIARAVPMERQTQYQVEYVEKPVIPVKLHTIKDHVKDSDFNITEPSAHMDSQTTTRSHYKSWSSAPAHPFAEKPTAAGHVLFPGANRRFDTTTGANFIPYPNISQLKPTIRPEPSENLRITGSMDLNTNYRQSYVNLDISSTRPAKDEKKNISNEQKPFIRPPMNGISQTTFDFRAYPKHRPAQLVNGEPFLSQFSIGNELSSVERDSQYRSDYQGYNMKQNSRQPIILPKDQQPYIAPVQKMDMVTITQRDFQPIDPAAVPRVRLVPLKSSLTISENSAPMENVTTNRSHYRPYEPSMSKRRFGEYVPNIYIPPLGKVQSTTTTGETYQGRAGAPARPCIPEIRVVNQVGEQDHNTNYRVDYRPHGLSICAAKAYTMAQNKQTTSRSISAQ